MNALVLRQQIIASNTKPVKRGKDKRMIKNVQLPQTYLLVHEKFAIVN